MSTDVVLPALGYMQDAYEGATRESISLVVSVFFAGLGLGQLFFGPLCDSLGRRYSAFIGLSLLIAGSIICIVASTLPGLIAGRFLQAFGASGPRIATMAIVRDKYEGNDMARIMSFIMMIFVAIPMLAPILGQIILELLGWQYIFYFLLLFSTMVALWLYFRQGETLNAEDRKPLNIHRIVSDFTSIIRIKSVLGFTIASGASYSLLVSYISSAQHIFQNIYDTGSRFPIYFALIAMSLGIASFFNSKLVRRLGMQKLVYFAMALNFSAAAMLLLSSLAADGVPELHLFISVMMLGFFGCGILMGNLAALALLPLGRSAGFGAAIISSLSTCISVPVAIVISSFVNTSIAPFAIGFAIMSCTALFAAHWASRNQ